MERITGMLFILISLFLLWSLRGAPLEAAAFPGALLVILIVLSGLLLIGRWKTKSSFENLKDVAVAAILMIAFVFFLPIGGFPVTTLVMLWACMWLGGYRRPIYKPPIIALVLTACIYIVFFKLLDVPPP